MKRYVSRHKKLSPYQREIVGILQEECAEIVLACSKMLRFGPLDGYPGGSSNNREDLGQELGDLQAVVHLAIENNILDAEDMSEAVAPKLERLKRYLQTKPDKDAGEVAP